MADELNIPTHRWYEPRNNIRLPKQDFSRDWIYDSGIQKIDAWINSQPWGNPVPALFSVGEQGVWFDPSDVANLNWRRNISLNSDAETLWAAAGTAPPTVALSQTYLSKTCAAITFAAGTGAGFSVSRADRALVGGTYTIASGTTYVMSYEISFSRALTGSEAIGVLQTGVQGINGFTFNASNTSDLVGAWLRISSSSALATASGTNYPVVNVAGAITASPVTVYVRAIQVEAGSVATEYQRITDVNTEVIERFPNATLYQDPAGTQPVTTTGQSVGLMLDKSKGLVLGPELVTNGDFSNGTTGWIVDPGWSITGGRAIATAVSANLTNSFTCVAGRSYRVEFDVVSYTSGDLLVAIGANYTGNPRLTSVQMFPGRKSVVVVAGSSLTMGVQFYGGAVTATIDNISVKELPGNHAVQATTAARPFYGIHPVGGRRNLLTWSEQFDNAIWNKGTGGSISANSVVAPDGTTTADAYTFATSTSLFAYLSQATTGISQNPNTFSVWVKRPVGSGNRTIRLLVSDVDVSTANSSTFTVTEAWQRFEFTRTSASTTGKLGVGFFPGSSGTPIAAGEILEVWGAQIEAGSTATAYQRVTDQYNVTEAGVPSVSYLFFDGADSMATPSINFATATSDGQARRNLLTFPTAFDDAAWTKTGLLTVSANSFTAPDGTTTADTLTEDTSNGGHSVTQTLTKAASAQTYTASAFVRPNGRTVVRLRLNDSSNTNNATAEFTLTGSGTSASPTVAGTFTSASAAITSVGGGWYRLSVTATTGTETGLGAVLFLTNGSSASYLGDGTSGILVWGAQLETGTTASAFQNIGTDKMTVFAGVRKLSDAALGIVVETSTTPGNGSISLIAPRNNGAATYGFVSRGTTEASANTTGVFAAPITNVLTGLGDIAGDLSTLRVNGTQVAQSTADQGTGTYLAYPLYIGHRFNNPPTTPSSLFFSGHLYSLIVRGAQSTADQISYTEAWVARETGFFTPVISGIPTVGVS